jgi:hypothetical protein
MPVLHRFGNRSRRAAAMAVSGVTGAAGSSGDEGAAGVKSLTGDAGAVSGSMLVVVGCAVAPGGLSSILQAQLFYVAPATVDRGAGVFLWRMIARPIGVSRSGERKCSGSMVWGIPKKHIRKQWDKVAPQFVLCV